MTGLKMRLLSAALGAALVAPASAYAAKSWVLPSTTVLSGPNAWVTFDAATSDELYSPNLRPLGLETIQIIDADGQTVDPQSPAQGKFRSTFDLLLSKPGTYKIASTSNQVIASWTENGEVKRFRGTDADFAKQVPAGATDLKTIRTLARSETFVTRDEPTDAAFKSSGQGIELVPVTHPSDVVVGEAARFRLLLDGKPAAGLEVILNRGGDRWKAKPAQISVKTGADGAFTVTLPEGGVWWMSASHQAGLTARSAGGPPRPGAPAQPPQPLAGDGYSASYTATVEAQLP